MIAQLSQLLLYITAAALSLAIGPDKPIIISLGFQCQVASQLKKHNLRYEAFPLDWVRTSFHGLCQLLQDDFKDYVNPKYLVLDPEKEYVHNTKYDVHFTHDFPREKGLIVPHWPNSLTRVSDMYQRRIKRFYEALTQQSVPVYLIRARSISKYEQKELSKQDVIMLRDLLLLKFPLSKWTLVIIDESEEIKQPWHINRVKNFYLKQPLTILGYKKDWSQIFTALGLIS